MEVSNRKQVLPGVYLTCLQTDQFKTGSISVNMMLPLSRADAAKNALIPRVLLRGTSAYPDIESLTAAFDELFGLSIVPVVRKKGEVQCVGFYASFADDRHVPTGEHVLDKVTALLAQLLLSPATSGGHLRGDYVESEKQKLISDIRSSVNDKRAYATDRLFELMCSGEAYGTGRFGTEKNAEKITAVGLTKHYKQVLSTAHIEIIYCGSARETLVERAVVSEFAAMPRGQVEPMPATQIKTTPAKADVRYYTDHLNVTQGKLAVGFRLGDIALTNERAPVMVANAMFGGSVTSKLFMNVRERLSLCYYASSSIDWRKGIMLVSSGIEFDKYDEALSEILTQLEAVRKGDFTENELESAKKYLITNLKTVADQQFRLDEYYLDQTLGDFILRPEKLAVLVSAVTAEDVLSAARDIMPDTVYFLNGPQEDGNED
ncbi:MAG: insulinase family protein [Oscillospiraceae bacterium]|nr:insulinase family protein [Oscillospiraceae bacterium]